MAVSDQALAADTKIDQLSINTIRTLSMDGVQKAWSDFSATASIDALRAEIETRLAKSRRAGLM